MAAGVPDSRARPLTSRKASSIDSPSTSGVVSRKISKTAALASEYAAIRGLTTTASGHSALARRPFMAVRTPNRRAS